MSNISNIIVEGVNINIQSIDKEDYINITNMADAKDNTRAADVIKNWIRNRSTIEFLGTWESIYNPDFKVVEFDHFRKEAGLATFTMSVSNWVQKTNAVGIYSVKGRYGGTYAHKDIAFEFGSAISPIFKLLVIKEYQRLKQAESDLYNLEWNVKRILTKANYHIHTDAVLKHIIPKSSLPENKKGFEYAKEADLLNLALFGCTAKEWREANPEHAKNKLNVRDFASINELAVMSNLESFNAEMIKRNINKRARYDILSKTAKEQMEQLKKIDLIKAVRKKNDKTYIEAQEMTGEQLEIETSRNILDKNKKALSGFNKKLKKGLDFNSNKDKK